MKILILAAMDKELSLLKNLFEGNISSIYDNFFKGTIENKEIIIAKCGIGKVNAALNCQILINEFKPDIVLNSGVAGGASLPIGSLLVADEIAYDDVWCGPGTPYGKADGYPLFFKPSKKVLKISAEKIPHAAFGLICTGDKFISTPEEIQFIKSKFPSVKAVDMESGAIAQTCVFNNIEFGVIRVVSDTPGEGENIEQYKDFWSKVPEKTFNAITTIIKNL